MAIRTQIVYLKTAIIFFCSFNFCQFSVASTIFFSQSDQESPFIEEIWIQGKQHDIDSLLANSKWISLPFDKNSITIQFNSVKEAQDQVVQYAYLLEGFDSTWVFTGDQRRAFYANLTSGSYTFKFKSSQDGISWQITTTPLRIVVITPFWSYWWFPLIAMLFVVLILFLIYKLRVNEAINNVLELEKIRKSETEALRVSMARDFHDEMGNKLASIIVLVSTLELLIKDKTEEIKKALNRIEIDSKALFSGTKTFIWSIDPKSDTLYEILNYIIHFGTDLYENAPMDFFVKNQVTENLTKANMRVGVSRQIFFILKEAMTNSLVHSKATKIDLSFHVDPTSSTFMVTLSDNGVGLDQKLLESPRGLRNMRTRAEKIDCHLALSNNLDGGLAVTLSGIVSDSHGL